MIAPGLVIGKYRVDSPLGRGGMGDVWKAWDAELGRWVALKFLLAGHSSGTGAGIAPETTRFQREAQTAAKLSHPGIAAIYEFGTFTPPGEKAEWFIAMQFVDGQNLRTFPRNNRKTLVRIVRDAARAVQAAHDQGVIHRDLKPENLMVQGDRVFVMDFGLSRITEGARSLSLAGLVIGTPSYMPPEQARAEKADARADVYALGATLYELLTDRVPFDGSGVYEILMQVIETEPARPRSIDPSIDPDLETILLKCLEKDRHRRYRTAAELGDDLQRWLDGEPIAARPISRLERLRRRIGRNKALTASIAALVILASGAAILFTRQGRERHASEERLKNLSTLWMDVLQKKQDLRGLKVPVERARPALEASIHAIDAFIKENPDLPQGFYLRARGYLYLGERDKALADVEQAIRLAPAFKLAFWLRAIIRLEEAQAYQLGVDLSHGTRVRAIRVLMQEVSRDFAAAGTVGPESARVWGLTPTAEDEVMRTMGEAMHRVYGASDIDGAVAILTAAVRDRHEEEYAAFLGMLGDREWTARAIEWAPGYPLAHFVRGIECNYAGQRHAGAGRKAEAAAEWAKALASFEATVALLPNSHLAWSYRGKTRAHLGDDTGALEDFNRSLTLNPNHPDTLVLRGLAYEDAGRLADALRDYDRAIELDPGLHEAVVVRAECRILAGDSDGALRDFDRAIELAPDNPVLFVKRAMLKRNRGDLDGALRDADDAVQRGPKLSAGYIGRAEVHLARNDPASAQADLDRAIEVAPSDFSGFYNRAILRTKRGDLSGARKDYDRALELRPNDADTLVHRGRLLLDHLGEAKAALRDLDQAVALRPDDAEALCYRGNAKDRLGDRAGALPDYDKALALKPDYIDALANRGAVRYKLGLPKEALADLDRAIALKPSHAESFAMRGLIKTSLRDPEGAAADFESALRVAPVDWPMRDRVKQLLAEVRGKR